MKNLDTTQDHGNNFFSADVHQYNIAFYIVHVQVNSDLFYLILYFFDSCIPGNSGQLKKAYLCFPMVCTNEK